MPNLRVGSSKKKSLKKKNGEKTFYFSEMGNNLYTDFSNDAPLEFKQKFTRAHKWYVVLCRFASCLNGISSLYPLCAGTIQTIIVKTSNESKYISDGLSISIPILVLAFLVMFALVSQCCKFRRTDVDVLLKYTTYFKVIPDITLEDQLNIQMNKTAFSANDFKLLQLKYH
jgi:hypothetical protein